MPKDAKVGKQHAASKGAAAKASRPSGGVVKLKSPKAAAAAAAATGSTDIPVKELEERRRQMRIQLQQVEAQVGWRCHAAMRPPHAPCRDLLA